ncbi:MAG: rhamnulokinase [Bacteroidales bacterium]|nr:rhamnulokinase [Bacteroidales bacterium]
MTEDSLAGQKAFLAFDCGATSGRAVLGTFGDGKFSMEEVYRFPNQVLEVGGRYYWNVWSIYEHFVNCLRQLGQKGVKVDSIGIDTWGVDFGCIAPDGSLLGLPRAYRDPYTAGVPEKVFRKIPRADFYAATGIQIMDFNTVFQLYAQTEEGSSALSCAECILFMPDLLSYLLTGCRVCEYTDASTSGMMDLSKRQFNTRLLRRLGIRQDVLLPIVQPGTPVGVLRPSLAAETGLGPVPVVAVAGHDTASAIAAVPASDERFAYLSSGTWSLMGVEVPAPIINEASARANFTNEGGIDGTTRFLKNITGMWLLEQCRKSWAASGRTYSYAELEGMARAEEAFPGRIDPDDPRFANPADMASEICAALEMPGQAGHDEGRQAENDEGSQAALDEGRQAALDEARHPRLDRGSFSDAQIVSCIYHSLADRYAEVLEQLRGFASFPIERLHIIGGGSANALLDQWTADATGIPVVAGPTEATAIGNLMLQARAAGLAADRRQMRRIIAEAFSVKTFYPKQ